MYRYYGCGPVFPEAVEGCHVLDLGSGAGRDCFILSKLVGEKGYVTGVDMTQEQVCLWCIYIIKSATYVQLTALGMKIYLIHGYSHTVEPV